MDHRVPADLVDEIEHPAGIGLHDGERAFAIEFTDALPFDHHAIAGEACCQLVGTPEQALHLQQQRLAAVLMHRDDQPAVATLTRPDLHRAYAGGFAK